MDLTCPRCSHPLQAVAAPRNDRPGEMILDRCNACHGVWYDGGEVLSIPALRSIGARRDAILAWQGKLAGGIARCPRCGEEPVQFPFLDLKLDYCPGCEGVWFDGTEQDAVVRAIAAEHGRATTDRTGDARTAPTAAAAVQTGMVACSGCKRPLKLSESLMTGDGPMHANCAEAAEGSSSADFAQAQREHRGATWGIMTLAAVALDVGLGPCPTCGGYRRGRCFC